MTMTLEARFWTKVEKTPTCWLWTASKSQDGYGRINVGTVKRAHRVAWEMEHGPIPEGMILDHLCRVRACVNPAHLEVVTVQENNRRGEGFVGTNYRKTKCGRNHELTPENTITSTRAGRIERQCRACKKITDREANLRSDRYSKERS